MSVLVDNLIAYRVLSMLVKPFEETDAYRLGIIDKDGNNLIKSSKLKTSEQREAYTYLHRLVFNLKKILNRLPGGDTKTKNLVAALWLVKEAYTHKETITEEQLQHLLEQLNSVTLVEEELEVRRFLNEDGIANVTGPGVSTDKPVVHKKDIEKYKILRRSKEIMK
ncbi:MAG: hypothetical protein EBU90_13425 [Proteobacteria bacterium]|nr:hypothetical protein [Pseudomonadota bacterium]